MTTKMASGMVLGAILATGAVRADDPNPDVAKAIQEIAARRAEKEEAKVRQTEAAQKNEAREGFGRAGASSPQAINPANPAKK